MKKLKSFMEAKHKKKMDPVDADELDGDHDDREDKDIDNDGDEDESDEYLHKRRKAIKKKVDEEVEELDELSQETLRQYHGKAGADLQKKREKLNKGTLTSKDYKQGRNRAAGLNRAADKMEDVKWPVYKRLMEKTKQPNDSGLPAQAADDIASKGAKDFMAQHGDRKPEDYVDVDKVLDMNKQDMYRNLPNKSKGRPNDQKVGQPTADKSNGKDKL